MIKVTLGPLDSETALVIAQRRGLTVGDLVSNLIQREAAIEITNWQATSKPADTPPIASAVQPQPTQAAQR
jgi:hypothetical protein